MTAEIDPERRLGALVRDNPEFASVFESVGIDYCCGGDATLAEACDDTELAVETVREKLRAARSSDASGAADAGDWDSLSALVDDIVETHHDFLRAELPSLERTVRKVVRVHGDAHPELHDVESVFLDLADEMNHHIADEEENVFPELERLDEEAAPTADEEARIREAIAHLEDEHDETAANLERLRSLTDDYAIPEDACTSYRTMLDRLRMLEEDTHLHIHKENNVLFPDARDRLAAAVAE